MSHEIQDFIPLPFSALPREESEARAEAFEKTLSARRSVRDFSDKPVPKEWIESAIRAASTAPSGAHRQPWTFVAISNPAMKREIRIAAEKEEYASYEEGRMPEEWREALKPIGTNWRKPFLETVPWIVVVFQHTWGRDHEGERQTNYYVKESVGIACGMFITALHNMGLATLTHTPSPMGFLSKLLQRPSNEKPYILFPVGFPAEDAQVPNLKRKDLKEVSVWFEG